jgi:hypothetical protein
MHSKSATHELSLSNKWVQVMLLSFVFIAIFGSVIIYMQYQGMISNADMDFYGQIVPLVGIFVITMVVVFVKEHKERSSAK